MEEKESGERWCEDTFRENIFNKHNAVGMQERVWKESKENGVPCHAREVGLNGQYHNQECQVGSEDKKENEEEEEDEEEEQRKEKTIGNKSAVRRAGGESGKG